MNERVWHFERDARRWGPVTFDELKEMVDAAELPATTLVSREGLDQWHPFESLAEIASADAIDLRDPSEQPIRAIDYYRPNEPIQYAGFGDRFAAFFLDFVILLVPFVLLNALNQLVFHLDFSTRVEPFLWLGCFIVICLYFALLESSHWQATVGKRMLGIKVTDTMGARISLARAIGRSFAKYLSALLFYAGFLMAAFTKRKQGLHDLMCDTLVLRR